MLVRRQHDLPTDSFGFVGTPGAAHKPRFRDRQFIAASRQAGERKRARCRCGERSIRPRAEVVDQDYRRALDKISRSKANDGPGDGGAASVRLRADDNGGERYRSS
jgi:hypothetical protein